MIDTVIALDEKDPEMGVFFNSCHEDLNSFFNENNLQFTHINSDRLTGLSISMATEELERFVFAAYSHGGNTSLLKTGLTAYISTTLNFQNFRNSFFYTCSCHSANELGGCLIENGCVNFIGYKNEFKVWDYYRIPFVECANLGLKLFFQGERTHDIINRMKEKYNDCIDNYKNDMFGAAMLVSNRNALVQLGENISLQDLLDRQ